MNHPKIADWIDEIAYQHFLDAWYDSNVDSSEYMRACTRAHNLKSLAMFLGQKSYSYYSRLADEATCE